jgi:hypothetical protein
METYSFIDGLPMISVAMLPEGRFLGGILAGKLIFQTRWESAFKLDECLGNFSIFVHA